MRPIPVLLLHLAALSACSSAPPRPAMPDGTKRVPVNAQQTIERYRATSPAAGTPTPVAYDPLSERLDRLEAELAGLRQRLAQTSGAASPNIIGSSLSIDGTEVVLRERSLLLRVPQPFAQANCTLPPALHKLLVSAALQSGQIDIRGRTDAEHGDLFNQKLALQRAHCMRQLLLADGIPPAKLRFSAMAAGDRIADNRSVAGQARNRRVEVELLALDRTILAQLAVNLAGSIP